LSLASRPRCFFGIFVLCLAAAGAPAAAQPKAGQAEKTNHVAACPGPVAQGAAKCSALIVTDKNGNIIVNKPARAPAANAKENSPKSPDKH
jgi:hypothetical protein